MSSDFSEVEDLAMEDAGEEVSKQKHRGAKALSQNRKAASVDVLGERGQAEGGGRHQAAGPCGPP